MSNLSVHEQGCLICLDIKVWSGRKKLHHTDLNIDEDKAPPELISLGSKYIVPKEALRPLNTAKKQAERAVLNVAIRFMKNYLGPTDSKKEISETLQGIKNEFLTVFKPEFLNNYTRYIDEVVAQFPQFESAIRAAVDPVSVVDKGIDFRFTIQPIQLFDDIEDDTSEMLKEAPTNALDVIAETSKKILYKSFMGKEKINPSSMPQIFQLRDKLSGLRFLDGRLFPIVDRINEVLDELPEGAVEGIQFSALQGIITWMSDPKKMLEHGELVMSERQSVPKPVSNNALTVSVDKTETNTKAQTINDLTKEVNTSDEEDLSTPIEPVLPEKTKDTSVKSGWFY
jgi:hypothetical protein